VAYFCAQNTVPRRSPRTAPPYSAANRRGSHRSGLKGKVHLPAIMPQSGNARKGPAFGTFLRLTSVTELPKLISIIAPFIGDLGMDRLNVQEAETKISSLLSDIEKNGKSFTICRNGKPVAELIPYRKPSRLAYNPVLARIQIHYDPTEDLSKDEWGDIE
jgi:antitoxin (DNA-binding transcriptional repressor) of toxin-antitoxin stability system